MGGEVTIRAALNRAAFQALPAPQKVYALIHVEPSATAAAVQAPLNLALVLDRSGSMAGEKIRNLRAAVKLVIERLAPTDLLSVVLFDDNVDTLLPCQPVSNPAQIVAQVERIADRGGTAISKGMRRGLDEVRRGLAPDRVSRVLLLTDGETWGDEDICRHLAAEAAQVGVPISALGLGDDWNIALLDAIGRESGGTADHLPTPQSIEAAFARTVKTMQGTAARNVQLTLRVVAGVQPEAAWRVLPAIGRLNARALSDRDVQLALGDLEMGKGQALLVELLVQPKPAGTYRMAQADAVYDAPLAGVTGEHARLDLMLALVDDPAQVAPWDAEVMNLVEKVSVHKQQTRALDAAQAGNVALATQQLRTVATRLLNLGEAELAQAAEQEAANLEQQGKMSPAGTRKLHYGTQKLAQAPEGSEQ